ncbi:unnamed protein product [Paramecium sonneborni]|uniref:Transmembrane protein n=1 Tax=Paramecium sonneborni TaxID=65129 RepID=A0A8S1N8T2_9CILI|nr:unnamed protein product [Paramecium sonneborni]
MKILIFQILFAFLKNYAICRIILEDQRYNFPLEANNSNTIYLNDYTQEIVSPYYSIQSSNQFNLKIDQSIQQFGNLNFNQSIRIGSNYIAQSESGLYSNFFWALTVQQTLFKGLIKTNGEILMIQLDFMISMGNINYRLYLQLNKAASQYSLLQLSIISQNKIKFEVEIIYINTNSYKLIQYPFLSYEFMFITHYNENDITEQLLIIYSAENGNFIQSILQNVTRIYESNLLVAINYDNEKVYKIEDQQILKLIHHTFFLEIFRIIQQYVIYVNLLIIFNQLIKLIHTLQTQAIKKFQIKKISLIYQINKITYINFVLKSDNYLCFIDYKFKMIKNGKLFSLKSKLNSLCNLFWRINLYICIQHIFKLNYYLGVFRDQFIFQFRLQKLYS